MFVSKYNYLREILLDQFSYKFDTDVELSSEVQFLSRSLIFETKLENILRQNRYEWGKGF